MNTQINKETATEEVNKWLETMRITPRKRDGKTEQISKLIEMVMYGEVSFNEQGNPVQKLEEPLPNYEELVYANRIKVDGLISKGKLESSADAFTTTCIMISSATGISVALAKKLDMKDLEVPSVILSFFQ
jgi:hypothetical protein